MTRCSRAKIFKDLCPWWHSERIRSTGPTSKLAPLSISHTHALLFIPPTATEDRPLPSLSPSTPSWAPYFYCTLCTALSFWNTDLSVLLPCLTPSSAPTPQLVYMTKSKPLPRIIDSGVWPTPALTLANLQLTSQQHHPGAGFSSHLASSPLCAYCALPELTPADSIPSPSFSPASIYAAYPRSGSPFLSLEIFPGDPNLQSCTVTLFCAPVIFVHITLTTPTTLLCKHGCVYLPLQTVFLEGRHWDLLGFASTASTPKCLCSKCLMTERITQ